MFILAIDPGIEKVGYSVFEQELNGSVPYKYITSGLIKTLKTTKHEKRIQQIYVELSLVVKRYKAQIIVMEQLFFFKNAKSIIGVAQAQGVVELLAAHKNIPLKYLTPLQIKETITGYGRADKQSVHKMLKITLKDEIKVLDDDQSDAIACGLAYCFLNKI
ncbi:crossover junction endodeoxyribonuclease RuvC [Candidatus Roizmanbacteria bacterium RIFCSPLOWO2_01_FULL_38_12]|uniref:Crossover junction endodeoxyribonuclease RuvC n=1 Tax=Candidatus Roizmanbacteria bacterium RIFCSPLOWO2_01_FULL_38_12 TaxID=1802061 RepID=A0A1F7IYJ1_9BACT|nr:MAG: crossover junction endodeoxyribonuclease RuvC [Candidatus Roizmanbacteria bacterium RIFCSPHIGHO2_12_FULL_38_13]OGK48444.1 MAG: crossover junction endodeoxyribonuclease RuvC [Candidatus Roizmanbacteria bacterium RIFCSPLOWO2_01_FULL_38_12]